MIDYDNKPISRPSSLHCNHLILTQKGWDEEYLCSIGLKKILEKDGSKAAIVSFNGKDSNLTIFHDICPYVVYWENYDYVEHLLSSAEFIWVITNRKEEFWSLFKKNKDRFHINPLISSLPVKTIVVQPDKHLVFGKAIKSKFFVYIFGSMQTLYKSYKNSIKSFLMTSQVFWPFLFRISTNYVYDRNTILIPLFGNCISRWRKQELQALQELDELIPEFRKKSNIKDLEFVLLTTPSSLDKLSLIIDHKKLKNTRVVSAKTLSDIITEYDNSLINLLLSPVTGLLQEEWLGINSHCFIISYDNPTRTSLLAQYPFKYIIQTEEKSQMYYVPKQQNVAKILANILNQIITNREYEAILFEAARGNSFFDLLSGYEKLWDYTLVEKNLFALQK